MMIKGFCYFAVCFGLGVGIICSALAKETTEKVQPSVYAVCLDKLPTTLELPDKAPETMRLLIPKTGKMLTDYEPLIAGKGWGASIKYHSAYCEVIVYAYNRNKEHLTSKDAEDERNSFDGFKAQTKFEKEVGDHVFYGSAGIASLGEGTDNQVQMVAIGAVHDVFIKYRTVCRHVSDIDASSNYRIADLMTSQVIKETLVKLDMCLVNAFKQGKSNNK